MFYLLIPEIRARERKTNYNKNIRKEEIQKEKEDYMSLKFRDKRNTLWTLRSPIKTKRALKSLGFHPVQSTNHIS